MIIIMISNNNNDYDNDDDEFTMDNDTCKLIMTVMVI